jgi:predicted DCC family thiol-disulfide oxidoreductase YuxK
MVDPARPGQGLTLVYDGDCPVCGAYVTRMRLRQAAGRLVLVDARQEPALVKRLERLGYDLDQGLVLNVDGQYYHGAAAVHLLALMSSRSGWFNRLNYHLFRSSIAAAIVYPPLVAGRRVLLWLLGRKPLSAGHKPTHAQLRDKP